MKYNYVWSNKIFRPLSFSVCNAYYKQTALLACIKLNSDEFAHIARTSENAKHQCDMSLTPGSVAEQS